MIHSYNKQISYKFIFDKNSIFYDPTECLNSNLSKNRKEREANV